MKVRTGFVSNSSSSSYVIILPDKYSFKFSEKKVQKLIDGNDFETTPKDVRETFNDLVKEKFICEEEYNEEIGILVELLKDNMVAEFPSGPGEGQIILLDNEKIKEILGKNV